MTTTANVIPQCAKFVDNKYPFSDVQTDVPLEDFAAVFGPDGLFDSVFHRASGRSRRHIRRAMDRASKRRLNVSERLLRQFQKRTHDSRHVLPSRLQDAARGVLHLVRKSRPARYQVLIEC